MGAGRVVVGKSLPRDPESIAHVDLDDASAAPPSAPAPFCPLEPTDWPSS